MDLTALTGTVALTNAAVTGTRPPTSRCGPNQNAAVVAYLQGRNDRAGSPTASATGNGFLPAASCALP